MKLPPDTSDSDGPNLTPVIDIVFLLLIFFLVAARYDKEEEERELDINLPQVAHTDGKPVFKTVALDATGVDALYAAIEQTSGERRLMEAWLANCLQRIVRERIPADAWTDAVERLKARQVTPYDAAAALLENLKS